MTESLWRALEARDNTIPTCAHYKELLELTGVSTEGMGEKTYAEWAEIVYKPE